jgi:hypothetical protein
MSLVLDELPRDPDRLLLMLQQMAEVIAQHNASLASLQAERDAAQSRYEAAQAEIEKLRLLIRQLQRGQFGRRSEKLDPDQLQLGLEDLEQTAAAAEAARETAATQSGTLHLARTERRRNLGALPAHLPRLEVLVDVEDKSCPCCGGALHAIGEDTSEMLDIKNALFAGSDGGARHWAIVASLVATARLNGLEPLAWLTDVLERVVSGRTKAHELERLLPWAWRAEQLAAAIHA